MLCNELVKVLMELAYVPFYANGSIFIGAVPRDGAFRLITLILSRKPRLRSGHVTL